MVQKTRNAAFGLVMPVIILGCIYGGITTPTEAAAIAVVYAIPAGYLIYRDLTLHSLYEVIWKTGIITGVLMILIFSSSMLARLWTMENVPQGVMETLLLTTFIPELSLTLPRLILGIE